MSWNMIIWVDTAKNLIAFDIHLGLRIITKLQIKRNLKKISLKQHSKLIYSNAMPVKILVEILMIYCKLILKFSQKSKRLRIMNYGRYRVNTPAYIIFQVGRIIRTTPPIILNYAFTFCIDVYLTYQLFIVFLLICSKPVYLMVVVRLWKSLLFRF